MLRAVDVNNPHAVLYARPVAVGMKAGAWSTHRVFPINLNGLSVNAPYKQAGSVEIPATCVTEPPYGGGGAPKGPPGVGWSAWCLPGANFRPHLVTFEGTTLS